MRTPSTLTIAIKPAASATGVQLCILAGCLDGRTAHDLERSIDRLLAAGTPRIVIDLSGVTYIASAGIGSFIGCHQRARQAGGGIQLAAPSPNVREIFAILGLSSVLTIHDQVDAAVAAA